MLVISNLSFAIEGKPLFEGASVTIPAGHKVGIVGRNGTGKTTLFKLIKGQLAPDSGNIEVPSYFRIGGVEQEAPASDASLLDTVLAADTERAALLLEAESCEDANRIGDIYQRLEDIDAYTAEPRASSILAGLGFSQHAQAQPCHEFSGGWRMRVALGAVLFSQPDLLLLDEPTNYLDLEGAYWLEQFLANYQKTALIISHDKELLNRSVNTILNLSHHSLTYYTGNYDQFDAERRAKLEQQHSMKRKQDAQRAHIQSFVDRFRAKASKARQAQSRLKQLERMQPIAALSENAVAGFSFPTPQALRPPLVTIEGGIVGYGEQPVLSRLNLRLDSDDRIALLGANGEGKSTLSKLIADRLPLMAGKAFKSGKLRVGFFAQHQLDELLEGESALQHILRLRAGDSEKSLRTRLASAGFNNDIVDMPVEKLSGGQKARLLMLIATIEAPHILILDEPTNHLDIESREALVLALNDYDGAVILVSHDTHLVEAVADRLWLVKDGAVTPFDGDMDEYKKLIMSSNRTSGNKTSASKANKRSKDKEGKSNTASAKSGSASAKKTNPVKLKSEIRRLDSQIEILASQKSALEAEMLKTDFYSVNDSAEIALKTKTFSDITAQLEKAEESWLELQEQL